MKRHIKFVVIAMILISYHFQSFSYQSFPFREFPDLNQEGNYENNFDQEIDIIHDQNQNLQNPNLQVSTISVWCQLTLLLRSRSALLCYSLVCLYGNTICHKNDHVWAGRLLKTIGLGIGTMLGLEFVIKIFAGPQR